MSYITLLCVLAALFVLEIIYFKIADRFNIIDKPSERGSSKFVTLRGGGIIFYIGAMLCFVLSGFHFPLFYLGLTIVSVISFVDDIHSLHPQLRLVLQFVGMLLLLCGLTAVSLANTWQAVIILAVGLVVCTGAMNIYNFMDGINGITGGYSLVVLVMITYALKRQAVPESHQLANLANASILSCLVFCFFNFRKKAKCFAGDIGSVSMAFIILFLLGNIMAATRDISWLAFLVVYGVDGCLTIIHRIILGEHITQPHRKHAYQLMANELHIPHVVVSLFYMFMQGVCCVWYLACPGYLTLCLQIVIISLLYVLFMKKYFYLHQTPNNA